MSENDYLDGQRMLATQILRELRPYLPNGDEDAWKIERMDTVARLREICEEFGDNDWTDELHLGDVVEKHLLRYLRDDPYFEPRTPVPPRTPSGAVLEPGECKTCDGRRVGHVRANEVIPCPKCGEFATEIDS